MKSTSMNWDAAIQKSNLWLKQLAASLNVGDLNTALSGLRAVLHTLRDRLPAAEAAHLAAQLPLLVKGIYFDGWNPNAAPLKLRTKADFLSLVDKAVARGWPEHVDPERLTRAVFELVGSHISVGEVRDIRGILPPELSDLWPAAPQREHRPEPATRLEPERLVTAPPPGDRRR
jgi:uncharacterized protein (DUF2267 family)